MPYNQNDPAISSVEARMKQGTGASEAYYDAFSPNRNNTIGKQEFNTAVIAAVKKLKGNFSRCQVQSDIFKSFSTPAQAATAWSRTEGWNFLHIHKAKGAKFRVYIPTDLRHIADIIAIIWATPSLTGFKVAGYSDANNRSDVVIAWVTELRGVEFIARRIDSEMLHGMRPPGTSIIRSGCLMGYSEEVSGSSVGTEVKQDLSKKI